MAGAEITMCVIAGSRSTASCPDLKGEEENVGQRPDVGLLG
jgi:hypothetical protein